ncbi:hypothetical protein KEJ27_05185 [Candidatus Bathyarchaeota archaeon]|nr:hypothetical protein [Candidatus Bathyarchaeota archaeon]MBS7614027.1 hypothetical protein [Candidatus Bathyarchaeota archaeon]MBS7618215.1 hypothetical protein [Candidatus Bathyarchaeota archaeon]
MNHYIPITEKLKPYLEGKIQESCSTKPSYIVRVKWGLFEAVASRLKERCSDLQIIGEVMFKCSKNDGTITFFVKNGKLIVEASSKEEALRILEDIFV